MRRVFGWLACGLGLMLAWACESSPSAGEAASGEGGEGAGGASSAGGKRPSVAGETSRAGGPNLLGEAGENAESAGGAAFEYPSSVTGVDCEGEPLEVDPEIVRRCVLMLSCLGSDGGRVSGCVETWPHFASYHLDVLPGVTLSQPLQFWSLLGPCHEAPLDSCQDVLACSGRRAVFDECDGAASTRCEGELAINCATREIKDCERYTGQKGACKLLTDPARADCVVKPSCAEPNDTQACDDHVGYRCSGGVGYGLDCAQFGASCVEFSEQAGSGCQDLSPPGKTCPVPGELACAGDVLTYCNESGLLFEHDCAVHAMTCLEAPEGAGGTGAGSQPRGLDCMVSGCELERAPDRCVGDDLHLSLGMGEGAGIVVHCPDYGFQTCDFDRCSGPLR